jgi:hypothetical protein
MWSAFRYAVLTGNAPDSYGSGEVFGAGVVTKFIDITVWDQSVFISFSYDGVTFGDDFEVDYEDPPLQLPFACSAFRIRNRTAGLIARYQVAGFW